MSDSRVEACYKRIHPRLWRSLLAYTSNPALASDAESEAFSQALRRRAELRDVDAWVWRSAFRIAAGLLKDQRLRHSNDATQTLDHLSTTDTSIEEFLSQLSELSEQQRAIVALRYVGNFKPTEIAELIKSTPGSVRVQLNRAHNELRASMERTDGY